MTYLPLFIILLTYYNQPRQGNDMWRFDGETWERVMISGTYPSQRILQAMTYDPSMEGGSCCSAGATAR